jgi:hypothetical protein
MAICYTFSRFDMLYQKNLATLELTKQARTETNGRPHVSCMRRSAVLIPGPMLQFLNIFAETNYFLLQILLVYAKALKKLVFNFFAENGEK